VALLLATLYRARVREPLTRTATTEEHFAVASCGLLPRATRPGPRLWSAFWSVANPHPREMNGRPGSDAAGRAKREDSYGQKAVQRRGPGRAALGSKPQLATAKRLVSRALRVIRSRDTPSGPARSAAARWL